MGGGLEQPFVDKPNVLTNLPWKEEEEEDEIIQISGGIAHTVVLTKQGKLFSCGSNDFSQLGHDKSQTRFSNIQALESYDIKSLSCGQYHNLAVDEWGKVFSWG